MINHNNYKEKFSDIKKRYASDLTKKTDEPKLKQLFHDMLAVNEYCELLSDENTRDLLQKLYKHTNNNTRIIISILKPEESADDLYLKAWLQLVGVGCVKDERNAIKLVEAAADMGHTAAQYRLGCYKYAVDKDKEGAMSLFAAAADMGHTGAQYRLGCCYEEGVGGAKDEKEAMSLFAAAADRGHTGAQYRLGCCYEEGVGGAKDEKEAVSLFMAAAEKGHTAAYCKLGTDQNQEEAIKLLKAAAEKGHTESQYHLGQFYVFGYFGLAFPGHVSDYQNSQESYKYYRMAAIGGHELAKKSESASLNRCFSEYIADKAVHGSDISAINQASDKQAARAEHTVLIVKALDSFKPLLGANPLRKSYEHDDALVKAIGSAFKNMAYSTPIEDTTKKQIVTSIKNEVTSFIKNTLSQPQRKGADVTASSSSSSSSSSLNTVRGDYGTSGNGNSRKNAGSSSYWEDKTRSSKEKEKERLV